MKIIYIRPGKSKGYLRLGIDTGAGISPFNISEAEYREAGSPLAGDDIDDSCFRDISRFDMLYRARIKALNILSYGDNSEKNLKYKLINKGIDREAADAVTKEMVERGYINSQRQLERLITNEVNLRNTGPAKLIPKLIAKGYSRFEIEDVIELLKDSGAIDFSEAKARLIAKAADEEEIKKILYKNGYTIC